METNQKEYPQFAVMNDTAAGSIHENSFDSYRVNPAVHARPVNMKSYEKTELGVVLTTAAMARKSSLMHTHETPIYLYHEAEPVLENLYLHIELWDEMTFRVIFSAQKEFIDYYAGIPEDMRMLVGKPQNTAFAVREDSENITLKTSAMTVCIHKETCEISAKNRDGVCFFSQLKTTFQAADVYDMSVSVLGGEKACFEALELENDELIYGLGERFDSLTRNGRQVDFHNKDAVGTTSLRTYVNIPFYMSTKGYGLFLNSSAKTDWQIATRDLSAVQFAVLEEQLDYFVIGGKNPKEILKGYCALTGFSKQPPLWSFGLWMSRNSYTSWDIVDEIAREVREYDIPCDVIHLDTAWFNRDWNCDLEFSQERFPNPREHIARYQKDGFRISLWQYNFIPPNDDNTHYHEAVKYGYLAKNKDGKPYQLPDHYQGSWVKDVIVDFSNPDARRWYADKIKGLIQTGAAAIKTDFGEGIPEAAVYQNIDGKHFHNLYSLVYNATVYNASKSVSGDDIVWARSGTAGSQRYPLHWGGDSQCTFEALAGTLRGALSIGISGIPYFSHDIGGFIGFPTDELYIRWAQIGLFSSHSRCHGAGDNTHREPWQFSKEACDIFRKYAKLRYSLMPYIYEQAGKCTETGLPMMRALYLEYPEDRNVYHIDNEYLFGDSLLIAPVLKPLSKTNIRNIYLPKGIWFDYFTKEKIASSGMWIERTVDLWSLPIFVKEGAELKYCAQDKTLQNGMGEIIKTEKW